MKHDPTRRLILISLLIGLNQPPMWATETQTTASRPVCDAPSAEQEKLMTLLAQRIGAHYSHNSCQEIYRQLETRSDLSDEQRLLLGFPVQVKHDPPMVMLASSWDETMDPTGWWMSEKLDGIRALWTGQELITRSGNRVNAPPWFTSPLPKTPLDGELWMGRGQFSQTLSIVRDSSPGEGWRDVYYVIFDSPLPNRPFEDRLTLIQAWHRQNASPHLKLLDHQRCQSRQHLQQQWLEIESAGGEGVVLRRPGSPYEAGRSHHLLKVKRFQDAEAVVVGHLPGSGRNQGKMGALVVELSSGIQFAIGTGFTDTERINPPSVGSTITFKHQGFTDAGIPRFASFLRIFTGE